MGRKFKLWRHPKNGERRKGAIRLESFVVSLPLDLYDLCCSLDCLGQCLGKRDDLDKFCKNAQALRGASACATSIKGNCRGNKDVDKAQHQKLNRRKSHS